MYAEAIPMDTVSLFGHFLHAAAVRMQLEAARIEEHLAIRLRHRFPQFYQVLYSPHVTFTKCMGYCNPQVG